MNGLKKMVKCEHFRMVASESICKTIARFMNSSDLQNLLKVLMEKVFDRIWVHLIELNMYFRTLIQLGRDFAAKRLEQKIAMK